MVSREIVFMGINKERKHQDKKYGDIEKNPHTLFEWISILNGELNEAAEALLKDNDSDCLLEILQIVSVGVACLEQHGIVLRK